MNGIMTLEDVCKQPEECNNNPQDKTRFILSRRDICNMHQHACKLQGAFEATLGNTAFLCSITGVDICFFLVYFSCFLGNTTVRLCMHVIISELVRVA